MAIGLIPVTSIPGWPVPLQGVMEQCPGHPIIGPGGMEVTDVAAVQAYFSTYAGSAMELAWHKQVKQKALDDFFNSTCSFENFIRAGIATNMTGANFATALSTVMSNYRSLKASIAAALTVAAVDAIDVTLGWPSNP